MIVVLCALCQAVAVERNDMETSFIKLLDDHTMRDTIKKIKRSFVLFHADHQRNSDVAYSYYASVAKKYKDQAEFFVVPGSVGTDVARTYSVANYPTLLHFRMGTKLGVEYGMYSRDSVERFIANWTKPSYTEVQFAEAATESEIWNGYAQVLPDRPLAVIMLCDNTTKFGRAALQLSEELGNFFPFVKVSDKDVAKKMGVRFPSLVMLRFEDLQTAEYTGEPDIDEMFIWAQHNAIPGFRSLETNNLFSPDGVSVKSAVAFLDTSDGEQQDRVFPVLGKHSYEQNWIKLYYADVNEHAAMMKLFGIEKVPQMLYVSANFTHCQYKLAEVEDNATFNQFFEETLPMTTIETPVEMFGGLRPVTEFAFEKMAEEGPFFTLFTSAFCAKCRTMKNAAIDAAQTIIKNGGKTKWAFWDVTVATPSFQHNISLNIPSVLYFPTKNVSEGITYMGPQNFLSIVEWAHGQQPDSFDLDDIMTKELGGQFDDI